MPGSNAPGRAPLHVYLGPAPGVGKTYAMLDEGCRLAAAGVDVVVGWIETHGREDTSAMCATLEVVPPRTVTYRGAHFSELDVDALLSRGPAVALVDELAHSNILGSGHDKRWQDVDELLGAGVGIITSINVQHLESLGASIDRLTGVRPGEVVPDSFISSAERVDLVDVSPEVLRRRVGEGGVLAPEMADAALVGFFNSATLTALRDLANRWLEIRGLPDDQGSSPFLDTT